MRLMVNCWSTNRKPRMKVSTVCIYQVHVSHYSIDWEEAFLNLREALGLPPDTPTPKIPRPISNTQVAASNPSNSVISSSKRKATSEDGEVGMDTSAEDSKKVKTTSNPTASTTVAAPADSDASRLHAQAAASYIPFLDVEHLLPPKLPTHDEMEGVLLALRKKALVEEYFGDAP